MLRFSMILVVAVFSLAPASHWEEDIDLADLSHLQEFLTELSLEDNPSEHDLDLALRVMRRAFDEFVYSNDYGENNGFLILYTNSLLVIQRHFTRSISFHKHIKAVLVLAKDLDKFETDEEKQNYIKIFEATSLFVQNHSVRSLTVFSGFQQVLTWCENDQMIRQSENVMRTLLKGYIQQDEMLAVAVNMTNEIAIDDFVKRVVPSIRENPETAKVLAYLLQRVHSREGVYAIVQNLKGFTEVYLDFKPGLETSIAALAADRRTDPWVIPYLKRLKVFFEDDPTAGVQSCPSTFWM